MYYIWFAFLFSFFLLLSFSFSLLYLSFLVFSYLNGMRFNFSIALSEVITEHVIVISISIVILTRQSIVISRDFSTHKRKEKQFSIVDN